MCTNKRRCLCKFSLIEFSPQFSTVLILDTMVTGTRRFNIIRRMLHWRNLSPSGNTQNSFLPVCPHFSFFMVFPITSSFCYSIKGLMHQLSSYLGSTHFLKVITREQSPGVSACASFVTLTSQHSIHAFQTPCNNPCKHAASDVSLKSDCDISFEIQEIPGEKRVLYTL